MPLRSTDAGITDFGSKTSGSAFLVAGNYATCGGGDNNQIGDNLNGADYSTICGGRNNTVSGTVLNGVICGGLGNTLNVGGSSSFIGAGTNNIAGGIRCVIGGGNNNACNGAQSVVCGGDGNIATGVGATVGGGTGNFATADGSCIPGGISNSAPSRASFASGEQAGAIRATQYAHASGMSHGSVAGQGSAQYGRLIYSGGIPGVAGAESVVLKTNSSANDFVPEPNKSYIFTLSVIATKSNVAGGAEAAAGVKQDFVVTCSLAGLTLIPGYVPAPFFGDATVTGSTITPNGGASILTLNFQGPVAAIKLDVAATLEWTEILHN